MAIKIINTLEKEEVQQKELQTIKPNGDLVLITAKVNILGVELFCGSLVLEKDGGLEFQPCRIIEPNYALYSELFKSDVKEHELVYIERKFNKGYKKLKHTFKVSKTKADAPTQKIIKEHLATLDADTESLEGLI